jgi:cholesterol transport system auxiliary component
VLVVQRPEARPALDTLQMAYSLRPHHIAYFARHQWAERPAQMLQPLLLRTLERTGCFAAVVAPPAPAGAPWMLRTELAELLQDFAPETAVLRLTLRLRFEGSGRSPAVRELTVVEPLRQQTPLAGVAAANAATARALAEAAWFVLEQLP